MAKARIKLTCKQVINANAKSDFERNVYHASYNEFLMKSQAYNPEMKFKTLGEIKANDGRANSLHYKLGVATSHFTQGLDDKIPGMFNTLGNRFKFFAAEFKLAESDIADNLTIMRLFIIQPVH